MNGWSGANADLMERTDAVDGRPRRRFSPAPATLTVVAVSVAIYVAQRLSGTWHGETDNVWHALGYHRSSILHGQVWRVFTPNLIHTIHQDQGPPGLGHLIFNMITLLGFGPAAERIFGWRRFLVIYVVCGSVAYGWLLLARPPGQGPYSFGGGSSGSIFGVLGALLVALLLRQRRGRERVLLTALIAYVAALLYLTVATDIAGNDFTRDLHSGGFVAGLLLGAAIVAGDRTARPRTSRG
jgi:membrane associated rhomboid family serine protease